MQDRIIVITGAASGIGRATALLCAQKGARLALIDLNQDALDAVVTESAQFAAEARSYVCDVSNEAAVTEAFSKIGSELGIPRGLVAAAGVDLGGFAHELASERWQRVLDINLNGSFYASKMVLKALVETGQSGSIVLCSSPASFVAFAAGANSAYAASKGAISSLTRTLAVDYARHGIRVNAIVPGPTETPLMWMAIPEEDRPAMRKVAESEVPIGRLADPIEIAQAAVWLLSDDSSYVIGSHLVCDGGVLAKGSVSF
jgi:NAD(P)-dependent dehydrogenase (short-subunit alcohol dehydrogenase family)